MPEDKLPMLNGTAKLDKPLTRPILPSVNVDFSISPYSASGISFDKLQMVNNEQYPFYKGIRFITKSGNFQVR
jgi:hypothetical protein